MVTWPVVGLTRRFGVGSHTCMRRFRSRLRRYRSVSVVLPVFRPAWPTTSCPRESGHPTRMLNPQHQRDPQGPRQQDINSKEKAACTLFSGRTGTGISVHRKLEVPDSTCGGQKISFGGPLALSLSAAKGGGVKPRLIRMSGPDRNDVRSGPSHLAIDGGAPIPSRLRGRPDLCTS